MIFSPEAYQRGLKSVNKLYLKPSTANLKAFEKFCRQDFASVDDALKSLSQFESTLDLTFLASLPSVRTLKLQRKSCFILASNQLDQEALSDQELIGEAI